MCFFTFFKLPKWYQIAQRITYFGTLQRFSTIRFVNSKPVLKNTVLQLYHELPNNLI